MAQEGPKRTQEEVQALFFVVVAVAAAVVVVVVVDVVVVVSVAAAGVFVLVLVLVLVLALVLVIVLLFVFVIVLVFVLCTCTSCCCFDSLPYVIPWLPWLWGWRGPEGITINLMSLTVSCRCPGSLACIDDGACPTDS